MPATPDTTEPTITAAVHRCCDAWHHRFSAERAAGACESTASERAGDDFRNAIPFLSSPSNIDAFIACVTYGMLLGIVDAGLGTKLLYAVQVAIASRRNQQSSTRRKSEPDPESQPANPVSAHDPNSATATPPTPSPDLTPLMPATPTHTPSPSPNCHPEDPAPEPSEGEGTKDPRLPLPISLTPNLPAQESNLNHNNNLGGNQATASATSRPPADTPTPLPPVVPGKRPPQPEAAPHSQARPANKHQKHWKPSHWRPVNRNT